MWLCQRSLELVFFFFPSAIGVRDTRTAPGFSMLLGIWTPALTPVQHALSPASAQEFLMLVKSSLSLCCFIFIHYLQRLLPKPKSEACTPMHVLAITKMFGVALPRKSIWNGLYKAEISHSLGSMELSKESKALWLLAHALPHLEVSDSSWLTIGLAHLSCGAINIRDTFFQDR